MEHPFLGERIRNKETGNKQVNKFGQLGINVNSMKKTKAGECKEGECCFCSAFMLLILTAKEIKNQWVDLVYDKVLHEIETFLILIHPPSMLSTLPSLIDITVKT